MLDLVEIKLINAVTDGFPFMCPLCNEVKENWDYIRVYLKNG